jgi:hypothetical protein
MSFVAELRNATRGPQREPLMVGKARPVVCNNWEHSCRMFQGTFAMGPGLSHELLQYCKVINVSVTN